LKRIKKDNKRKERIQVEKCPWTYRVQRRAPKVPTQQRPAHRRHRLLRHYTKQKHFYARTNVAITEIQCNTKATAQYVTGK